MSKTTNELKQLLADSYALYLKSHNYHWNVVGPHFVSLHALFEEHYTDLATAIDAIAERIRAKGDIAPGGFGIYQETSKIKDGDPKLEAMEMVKDLIKGHEAVAETLRGVIDAAGEEGDDVSEDLAIGRLEVHEETIWMLRSVSGEKTY